MKIIKYTYYIQKMQSKYDIVFSMNIIPAYALLEEKYTKPPMQVSYLT